MRRLDYKAAQLVVREMVEAHKVPLVSAINSCCVVFALGLNDQIRLRQEANSHYGGA
jgi:hypothetical protein